MYSSVVRDGAYKSRLCEFIRQEYRLAPAQITPAKRGFYGETWRLDTENGPYFLKLDYSTAHKGVYERSFPAIEHLRRHGIDFVSKIVKTCQGALCTRFDGAVLGLFDWIDGENIETDDTKGPEYQMLAKVYTVPTEGLDLRREDFSAQSAARFYQQWDGLKRMPPRDEATRILTLFEENRANLERWSGRLDHFSGLCQGDLTPFFITHGDAGGNLIVGKDGYFIVDWDDPVLAPPERDGWFMYGQDWAADTFHRALRQNGIPYTLRPERLLYYIYHYIFFYLTELLDGFLEAHTANEIEGYFKGWVMERVRAAETV